MSQQGCALSPPPVLQQGCCLDVGWSPRSAVLTSSWLLLCCVLTPALPFLGPWHPQTVLCVCRPTEAALSAPRRKERTAELPHRSHQLPG